MIASGGDDGATSASRAWCRAGRSRATGNTTSTARCSPRRRAPTTAAPACSTPRRTGRRRLAAGRQRRGRPAGRRMRGNMFVPVDLLKPILAELQGARQLAQQPARLDRRSTASSPRARCASCASRRQPGRSGGAAARRRHRAHRRRARSPTWSRCTGRCGAASAPEREVVARHRARRPTRRPEGAVGRPHEDVEPAAGGVTGVDAAVTLPGLRPQDCSLPASLPSLREGGGGLRWGPLQ